MQAEQLAPGSTFNLYVLKRCNGECPAEDYLLALVDTDQREFAKLQALLDRTKEHGQPVNEEKFKSLGDGIFELKSGHHRLLCFFDGRDPGPIGRLVLTHGFRKTTAWTPKGEIARAIDMKDTYRGGTP